MPPRELREWLYNPDSLTQRLLTLSEGELRVQVIAQGFCRPRTSERHILGLAEKQVALVREVLLLGCGQPWVFARSILPLTTLSGRYRFLRHLGGQPLGALLFKDPSMRRGKFELMQSRITELNIPPAAAYAFAPETTVWGRRSVFYLGAKPLLVGEYFLPDFTP